MNNPSPTSGNPGTNGRTLHSPNLVPMPQGGLTILSILTNLNATMIPPPSRPIVPLLHSPPTVHTKIHTDPAQSNHVSPPVPSLQDMSPSIFKMVPKKNGLVMWCMLFIIQIGCELPMKLKPEERPEVTTSMPQDDYDAAKEQLHQVDARIPDDIVEKAIQLFFSTNLLPDYDLSTCYVRELPNTSMLALIMPLPSISRFSMPAPFGNQHSHTWALCHGTTFSSATTDPLGGKIRPANWNVSQKSTGGILSWPRNFQFGHDNSDMD